MCSASQNLKAHRSRLALHPPAASSMGAGYGGQVSKACVLVKLYLASWYAKVLRHARMIVPSGIWRSAVGVCDDDGFGCVHGFYHISAPAGAWIQHCPATTTPPSLHHQRRPDIPHTGLIQDVLQPRCCVAFNNLFRSPLRLSYYFGTSTRLLARCHLSQATMSSLGRLPSLAAVGPALIR